jgi:hypothetical protein
MKAFRLVAAIIMLLAMLQAQGPDQVRDFSLSYFSAGTTITLHAVLTYDGKGERLVATAKNESGAPIQHAKICIHSDAMKAGCLFEMWNSEVWAPGAEVNWNVTTPKKVPDLLFEAAITEFKAQNAPETTPSGPTAQSVSGPPPLTQAKISCAYFTVVVRDKLNNVKQGLSPDEVKWFQKSFAKKYPGVCYADPAPTVPVVFYVTVTPDVYHGTRVVNRTTNHSNPVSGTVTDESGGTSQINGTVETTTTSSTAVPYSVDYGIYTLSVERRRDDGKFDVLHRFQQKGLYNTLYGVPLGGRGYHPLHAVIEDATKWVGAGGLTDPKQSAF